mmetsp:Transcript_74949/g.173805  ORF Transcript_74949/g.173805 Transcript_74949/m.173805 type:complete len:270 (-) Transcript_74949:247-1056(-)
MASAVILLTKTLAGGQSRIRPTASPTMTAVFSGSPLTAAVWYWSASCFCSSGFASTSCSRSHQSRMTLFASVRMLKGLGQAKPRAMSGMLLRTVASPLARKATSCSAAGTLASALAQNREPNNTPSAPSIRVAANPRPSAMPPAARSSVLGLRVARRSAASATKLMVPRTAPCPPASEPCATTTAAPASSASCTWTMLWHWQISGTPTERMTGAKGPGLPKESITALGLCFRACSSSSGCRASDQVMKPMPTRASPTSAKARSTSYSRP